MMKNYSAVRISLWKNIEKGSIRRLHVGFLLPNNSKNTIISSILCNYIIIQSFLSYKYSIILHHILLFYQNLSRKVNNIKSKEGKLSNNKIN